MKIEEMVEKFQCPGCVCGSDTECGSFKLGDGYCESHVLGTMIGLGNSVALGLPRGFCKPGVDFSQKPPRARSTMDIRLWHDGGSPVWDHLNVPVWAMEQDGFLFVRTFAPRINMSWVDVIEGGTIDMVDCIDVAAFIDEID